MGDILRAGAGLGGGAAWNGVVVERILGPPAGEVTTGVAAADWELSFLISASSAAISLVKSRARSESGSGFFFDNDIGFSVV